MNVGIFTESLWRNSAPIFNPKYNLFVKKYDKDYANGRDNEFRSVLFLCGKCFSLFKKNVSAEEKKNVRNDTWTFRYLKCCLMFSFTFFLCMLGRMHSNGRWKLLKI